MQAARAFQILIDAFLGSKQECPWQMDSPFDLECSAFERNVELIAILQNKILDVTRIFQCFL